MSQLSIQNLGVTFSTPGGDLPVLRGISLTVPARSIVGVVGESGSGKSTLIRTITGTVAANGTLTADEISLAGRDLLTLDDREYARLRGREIGFIPQDALLGLNPLVPVGRLAEEPLRKAGVARAERRRRILEVFEQVGLPAPERVYRSYAHELSGGMCQRVLIAAAISTKPKLLIADEPTSALDVTIQKRILDLLVGLRDELGCSIILVTHDLGIAEERTDRLYVLNRGRLVEEGTPAEVLSAPTDAYTKLLLESSSIGRLALARTAAREPGTTATSAPTGPATAEDRPHVRVEGLSKVFRSRRGADPAPALDTISFDVQRSSTLGIVGESGSGKTTLLRIVAGLEKSYSGSVRFDTGESLDELQSKPGRDYLKRRVQVIYQGSYASLDPRLKVGEILEEPLTGFGYGDRVKRSARINDLLDRVRLPRAARARYSSELSGGQRQRVAIARALAGEPDLLLADEPVSALDVTVQSQILTLLREIQADLGVTTLFVSHDLSVISDIADDTLVLLHGKQVDYGPSWRVLQDTGIDYIRELVEAIPGGGVVPGRYADRRMIPRYG